MELKDFISTTLQEIISGVKDAQDNVAQGGGINPKGVRPLGNKSISYLVAANFNPVQNVTFDVAVNASEGQGTKGGIGVFVGPIGLGTQGQSESSNTSFSRINFCVPVIFPLQEKRE